MSHQIAGWPAVLESLELEHSPKPGTVRTLEIWTVADLESVVDTDELLRNRSGEEPPYWALVWIGARAIAAQMLDMPPGPETRVLDLGCGLGLSGIAAGLQGAHVVFADAIPEALEFARSGAIHNGLTDFETRLLDFTKDTMGEAFDVILAADIVYQPQDYSPLVDFLDAHLARPGVLLLTESLRADAKQVVAAIEGRGLARTTQAVWIPEQNKRERTWIHRFVR